MVCVWSKIYSRKFLEKFDLKFNDYPCVEDIEFSVRVVLAVKKVFFLDEFLYNYRSDMPDSLYQQRFKYYEYYLKSFYVVKKLCKDLEMDTYAKIMSREYDDMMFQLMELWSRNIVTYGFFKKFIQENYFEALKSYICPCNYMYSMYILKYPEWIFKIIIFMKKFLKKHFLGFFMLIVKINKKLKGITY